MAENKKKEIIGYYTDDRNIYCVDCISKAQEVMKKNIEEAITSEDAKQELIFCDDFKEVFRWGIMNPGSNIPEFTKKNFFHHPLLGWKNSSMWLDRLLRDLTHL